MTVMVPLSHLQTHKFQVLYCTSTFQEFEGNMQNMYYAPFHVARLDN